MTTVGSAEFEVGANLQPLRTGMSEAEQVARSGSARISSSISGELKKSEEAAKRAGEGIKRAFEIGGALAGVALGLEGLRRGLEKVIEVTRENETVQLALNRTYGAGTAQFNEFAKAQAAATGQSTLEFQKASAEAKSLATNYGLTNQQVQELIKRSADLAVVNGKSVSDSFHRVEAAIRGEAESAEALGLTLNSNAVKAFANLTDEQRKNFDSLDQVTKAQLIYSELMRQSAQDAGAAEHGAGELSVAFSKLEAAGVDLAQGLGKAATPALVELANTLDTAGKVALALVVALGKVNDIKITVPKVQGPSLFEQIFGRKWGEAGAGTLIGPGGQWINTDPAAGGGGAGEEPTFGPSTAEVAAAQEQERIQAARSSAEREAAKRHAKEMLEDRKDALAARVEQETAALEKERRAVERAYTDERAQLEKRKEVELRTASDVHDAAVTALEDEAKVAAEAFERRIALAERARDDELHAAEQTHQDTIRGIEAEAQATKDAADAQIKQAEIVRDRRKEAAQDARDAAIAALDDEKEARSAARVQEDRALADSAEHAKQIEDDRHQTVVRGYEDETKAANDSKAAQLRAIAEQEQAAQRQHDRRAQHLKDELDQQQKIHDAALAAIQGELDAAQQAHDERLRALSNQGEQAHDEHDRLIRAGEEEQKRAEALHEATLAQLAREAQANGDKHEAALRQIDDEGRAANDHHDQLLRQIGDEADAAAQTHAAALRALDEQAQAEDDRHRHALDAIDEEQRARQQAIDAQLANLDALDKADQQSARARQLQDRLKSATTGVLRAQSTGNQSEIDAAQRQLDEAQKALDDEQVKNARDAARDELKAKKDALSDEISARKDAENERTRLVKAQLAEEKQAADDRLKLVASELAGRKEAADDELKLIRAGLEARKREADDEYKLIADELAKRREAADAELQLVKEAVAGRKQAEDDKLKATLARLAAEKQAADDALKAEQDRLAKLRTAADDTLKQARERIDAEIRAEDEKLSKIKDRLDKRKIAVEDANKAELEGIDKRKRAEQDAHDDAIARARDVAEQAKRAVADRRLAEDTADKARREQIQAAYEAEQRAIKATYEDDATGIIPALKRASEAAQREYGVRKQAANDAYQSEQDQIRLTYDDPLDGVIAKLRAQAKEAQDRYKDRKDAVDAAYNAEKDRIREVYDDPVNGLFRKLADAKQATLDALADQVQKWRDWKRDVTKEIDEATKSLDEFIKKVGGLDQIGVVPTAKPGEPGGPFGPRAPGGAGSSAGVPAPYRVTFPFDAPYNGPYAGGAAWPGGPPRHRGVDLALPGADNGRGTPYGAFQPGRVAALISESQDPAGGNGILIQTESGLYNYYGHNERFLVRQGDQVEAGQQIGVLGRSGLDPGMQTHLHYEVRRGINGDPVGQTIDPVPFMAGAAAGAPGAPGGEEITLTVQGRQFTFRVKGGGDFVGPRGNDEPEFQRLLAEARKAAREFDLPAAIIAAIPINEGRSSQLQQKYHNLFSIKGTGPAGSVNLPTEEVVNGQRVVVNDPFRVYHDDSESFEDFGRLVTTSGIYDDAVAAWKAHHNATEFMELLGHHYATDPNFPRQVLKIAGYQRGTVINEPTLLAGLRTGSLGIAGETGAPERLLGTAATAAYEAQSGGGRQTMQLNVVLGNDVVKTVWISGYKLLQSASGLPRSFGSPA